MEAGWALIMMGMTFVAGFLYGVYKMWRWRR